MSKSVIRPAAIVAMIFAVTALAWGGSIKVMSSGNLQYLATSKGMTLYYFAKDANGKSACSGGCAKYWPPFYASSLSGVGGLSASNFGTITRSDGSMQTTYKGWPLYTFAGDKQAGDTNGQGFKGVWFVASDPFYTVMDADSSAAGGPYLVDAHGKTLYYFKKDSIDKSVCNGGCAKLWPPFDASTISVPSGLKASSFSTITRSDGSTQVAYKGYPLYYFVKDQLRGQVSGNGFRKVWYVVDPAKFDPSPKVSANTGSSNAVASSASGSSASSGSGW